MLRERLARISAEAAWIAGGQVTVLLGNVALIKILTNQLGPATYGQLALGMTIAGVLHMFVYGPFEQVMLRYVSVYRERGALDVFFAAVRTLHFWAATLVVTAVGCAAAVVHAVAGSAWSTLVVAGTLFGLVSGVNATLTSLHNAFRHRKVVALHQAGDVWLRLTLATMLISLAGPNAPVVLFGFLAATTLVVVSQFSAIRTSSKAGEFIAALSMNVTARRGAVTELLGYGSPYIGFALFAWLSAYADRWIILANLDEHSVGIYAAISQIANAPIALFVGITSQLVVPRIFDRAGAATTAAQMETSSRLLYQVMTVYTVGIAAFVALTYVFAEPLVALFTSAEFARAAHLLWLICAGLGLATIGQLLVVKGLCYNRPQDYIWPKVIQTIAFLTAALLLVGPLGLTGIALAVCVSGAANVITTEVTNRRLQLHTDQAKT